MNFAILSRNAALYSTSRLVRAAQARGHAVDVLDPLLLQIAVLPKRNGLAFDGAPLKRYDVVIPRIGASITAYGSDICDQFALGGSAVINSGQSIRLARDKVLSLQQIAMAGVRVPRTLASRAPGDNLKATIKTLGGMPLVAKLQHGTQGIGTMICDTPLVLASLLDTLWAMGQQVVLQEFIKEAKGRDLRVLVVGGKAVAAMQRNSQQGDFRANLHRGGEGKAARLSVAQRRAAESAATLLKLDVCGVDILLSRRGPLVIEVNSSPGLEGIESVTEIDVANKIIDHAENVVEG